MYKRSDYINGKCNHREYYRQIGKLARINFNSDSEIVKLALLSKDEYYNDIPLYKWNSYVSCLEDMLTKAFKECDDNVSLARGGSLRKP